MHPGVEMVGSLYLFCFKSISTPGETRQHSEGNQSSVSKEDRCRERNQPTVFFTAKHLGMDDSIRNDFWGALRFGFLQNFLWTFDIPT